MKLDEIFGWSRREKQIKQKEQELEKLQKQTSGSSEVARVRKQQLKKQIAQLKGNEDMKLDEIFADQRPDESQRLTSGDVEAMMAIRSGQAGLEEDLFEKLYSIFLNSGEMPYGVAKARTGDPYVWIEDQISEMDQMEFKQFVEQNSGIRGMQYRNRPRKRMGRQTLQANRDFNKSK